MELLIGDDGLPRCWWAGSDPDYLSYHDTEWGFPLTDDRLLFEKLCLEGFQSGLSWLTILRKRDNFRAAFADFDAEKVAGFDSADIERLMNDVGIVRNNAKIRSTINNAVAVTAMAGAGESLASLAWSYAPPRSVPLELQSTTPESTALAKDLKRRGWSFIGPTTVYAFMQAVGIVNDHLDGCAIRLDAENAYLSATLP